jgi:hypothetical protein
VDIKLLKQFKEEKQKRELPNGQQQREMESQLEAETQEIDNDVKRTRAIVQQEDNVLDKEIAEALANAQREEEEEHLEGELSADAKSGNCLCFRNLCR